jgi:hypothetical protein
MSLTVYIVSAVSVFFFSGVMAMAGLRAAFIFVPLFYYLVGVPLAEAKCILCHEYVFERYVRIKDGQPVCIPCSGYEGKT